MERPHGTLHSHSCPGLKVSTGVYVPTPVSSDLQTQGREDGPQVGQIPGRWATGGSDTR